jgi:predicted TIM-barrel fold metal-dependent hydrolase
MTTRTCAPPLPHPTQPKYVPPPLACDAHCHVFGPPGTFPYAPDRPYTPAEPAPQERLARLHAHLGLARAVVVQATPHGADNRAVLDAIAASGGSRRGVALVGAAVTDAELEALHAGGVRGVRFNFVRHLGGAPDPAVFDRTVHQVRGLGWHVELHFDAEDIATYHELLRRMPVPYVIDHMGRVRSDGGLDQPALKALLALLRDERAWVKVSGAERVSASGRRPFQDAIPIARAIVETAPDRVLWGTDWPHPNVPGAMPDDGELLDLFAAFCADDGLRRKVLVDNPARLYWPESV